jgi:abscisic-aldehyde oxidase
LFKQGRGVDMSKIRIVQADTISMANTGMTSDSTTSEGSCAAVRAASEMLVARLRPIKEKLEKEGITGELPWETLIAQVNQVLMKFLLL